MQWPKFELPMALDKIKRKITVKSKLLKYRLKFMMIGIWILTQTKIMMQPNKNKIKIDMEWQHYLMRRKV